MSFSIDDNITSELQKLGNKAKRISNKAVRESAPIFAEELKAQTLYENVSDRSWKAQRQMDKKTGKKTTFKHMKDDIQVSGGRPVWTRQCWVRRRYLLACPFC